MRRLEIIRVRNGGTRRQELMDEVRRSAAGLARLVEVRLYRHAELATDLGVHVDLDAEATDRFVRHPGYPSALGSTSSTPLLLGSWWAFVPAATFAVRTLLEDGTLRRELPGYAEYAARVRHRLLPGLGSQGVDR